MKPFPELLPFVLVVLITCLMWVPYVIARARVQGLTAALGNPGAWRAQSPQWAIRAQMAHANAIENLAVFAPLVLAAAILGISTSATVFASKLFLGARVTHFAVYVAGIPLIRTLAFLAGVAATLIFAFTLVSELN